MNKEVGNPFGLIERQNSAGQCYWVSEWLQYWDNAHGFVEDRTQANGVVQSWKFKIQRKQTMDSGYKQR